jgi:hypothetical protein
MAGTEAGLNPGKMRLPVPIELRHPAMGVNHPFARMPHTLERTESRGIIGFNTKDAGNKISARGTNS